MSGEIQHDKQWLTVEANYVIECNALITNSDLEDYAERYAEHLHAKDNGDTAEDDIQFLVNLLRVPDLRDLSGRDVFELMINARHIAGNYWMFEGDAEALRVECEVVDGDGVTHGFRDMSDDEFLAHAREVFPSIDFSNEPPAWRML